MSWSDPCSYCGESRADCSCGHWGAIKSIKDDKVKIQLIRECVKQDSYWVVKTHEDGYKEKYLIYPEHHEHPTNNQ